MIISMPALAGRRVSRRVLLTFDGVLCSKVVINMDVVGFRMDLALHMENMDLSLSLSMQSIHSNATENPLCATRCHLGGQLLGDGARQLEGFDSDSRGREVGRIFWRCVLFLAWNCILLNFIRETCGNGQLWLEPDSSKGGKTILDTSNKIASINHSFFFVK